MANGVHSYIIIIHWLSLIGPHFSRKCYQTLTGFEPVNTSGTVSFNGNIVIVVYDSTISYQEPCARSPQPSALTPRRLMLIPHSMCRCECRYRFNKDLLLSRLHSIPVALLSAIVMLSISSWESDFVRWFKTFFVSILREFTL